MANDVEEAVKNKADKNTEVGAEGIKAEVNDGEAAATATPPPSNLRKKRIIIAGIALLVFLICTGVFTYFFIFKKSSAPHTENSKPQGASAEHAEAAPAEHKGDGVVPVGPLYVDLDDFIINLNSTSSQPSFLKLSVSLSVASLSDEDGIKKNMPKVKDIFQIYLRQLRPEDLKGSAGIFLLREELLLRLNKSLYPVKIQDILFNEIIVQ